MVVTGSRMYGFHGEDSDWDVYSVFVQPSVDLFSLRKPRKEFMTPERQLLNKLVSVKAEEIERFFNRVVNGDMKAIERVFSPVITMKTHHLNEIRKITKKLITQQTIESYLNNIEGLIDLFYETKDAKYLLYALRATLTADILARTKYYVLECGSLKKYYDSSNLDRLILAKKNNFKMEHLESSLINSTLDEINRLKKIINLNKDKFPAEPSSNTINKVNEHIISLRLQHMFSKDKKIILNKY